MSMLPENKNPYKRLVLSPVELNQLRVRNIKEINVAQLFRGAIPLVSLHRAVHDGTQVARAGKATDPIAQVATLPKKFKDGMS